MGRKFQHFLQGMIVLSGFPLNDQWKNPVDWKKFEPVPKVLIFGGKTATNEVKSWTKLLNQKLNPGYIQVANELQNLTPLEKVKVVPIIALPEVPKLFTKVFFSGFQKEYFKWGVAMDFDAKLSKKFGYDPTDPLALIAISSRGFEQKIHGKSSDAKISSEVISKAESLVNKSVIKKPK
jgi:hypothetical protein